MSRVLCHLIPSKFVRQELLKEFNATRFWLNHYEFVDFTVFEYGQRTQYLQWRVFSILITILLTAHVFFPGIQVLPTATPYSKFIYMHFWLSVLLILHSALELVVLTWTYYRTPAPILVRIHHTPWHFKLIWLMYNVLYPNILSCNVMYYAVIKDIEVHLGESRLFVALLASFAGIHISVTAIPSRMAHILQPLLFNGLHIVFTYVYQANDFTNHLGQNYVYLEIDWSNSRASAFCCSLIWLLLTSCCHVLMVCCCWYRRLVYRGKRTKSAKPIYGFSPEEYYPFIESEHYNHIELPIDDTGASAAGVTDVMVDSSRLKAHRHYSPHMSYRLVPVPRSMVSSNISDPGREQSNPATTSPRVGKNRYRKKGFKKARSRTPGKDSGDVSGSLKAQNEFGGSGGETSQCPARLKRRRGNGRKRSLAKKTSRERMKRDSCPGRKSRLKSKTNSVVGANSVADICSGGALLNSSEGSGKHMLQDGQGMEENTSPTQMDVPSEMEIHHSPSVQFLSGEYIDYLSDNISDQWEQSSIDHECAESVHERFSEAE